MGISDPIELYSVPEIFVDGFTKHVSVDGVMSCIGYRKMQGRSVVVLKLVWPAVNTGAAISDAMEALDTPARRRGAH
jgi:hypothetical protein